MISTEDIAAISLALNALQTIALAWIAARYHIAPPKDGGGPGSP